ncbi:MAG: hypothetical protein EZS28_043871, partial [Streblomastix strix]
LGGNSKILRPSPAISHSSILEHAQNTKTSLSIAHSIKSSPNTCSFNVSQTITEDYHKVADVLEQGCEESDGYEITLLDSEHQEYLTLSIDSSVLIKGGREIPTIWSLNDTYVFIIYLNQGKHTLLNIEFKFSLVNFAGKPMVKASYTSKVEIVDSTFNGISQTEISNNSMIIIAFCKEIILKNCTFQNASIYTDYQLITISASVDDAHVVIQDCKFINIKLNEDIHMATLQIAVNSTHKIEITGNTFTKCLNSESLVGALLIGDQSELNDTNTIIINNNTFSQNSGNYSGGFLLFTNNPFSNYNINNNTFSSNTNNQTKGVGKDSYLMFKDLKDDLTEDIVRSAITSMFNNSISDADKDSVHYTLSLDDEIVIEGSITLPSIPPPEPSPPGPVPPEPVPPEPVPKKKHLSIYYIIGISVGSFVIIVVIISIIIGVVLYKR